jgi:hypothetical protein
MMSTHEHVDTAPDTDEKGRIAVECMSDRELLKEAVRNGRTMLDVLSALGSFNPMVGNMLKMTGVKLPGIDG